MKSVSHPGKAIDMGPKNLQEYVAREILAELKKTDKELEELKEFKRRHTCADCGDSLLYDEYGDPFPDVIRCRLCDGFVHKTHTEPQLGRLCLSCENIIRRAAKLVPLTMDDLSGTSATLLRMRLNDALDHHFPDVIAYSPACSACHRNNWIADPHTLACVKCGKVYCNECMAENPDILSHYRPYFCNTC